jgi:hypothetical protein
VCAEVIVFKEVIPVERKLSQLSIQTFGGNGIFIANDDGLPKVLRHGKESNRIVLSSSFFTDCIDVSIVAIGLNQ